MILNNSIAFLCHPYHRGGVTRWMADAAMAWATDGMQVYFVTVEPEKEFISAKGRESMLQLLEENKDRITIISRKVGFEFEFGTKEYREYVYKTLLAKLPKGTPVIVSDDEAVWLSATFFHKTNPVIGVLHADEEHYYVLAKRFSGQVAALVCVSNRVNKKTRKIIPTFDNSKIYTIPCGINLPAFKPMEINDAKMKLVYLGRISEYQKRTSDLVKIAEVLKAQNVDFQLNIIGDGDASRVELERRVVEKHLENNVSFLGWLSKDNVALQLSCSDILVLTSDFEGTPIAMMEALAAGCGVVGTRVSGIEDYENHQLASDCFSVFEVGAINEAVTKIIRLKNVLLSQRQDSARQLAETKFSMKVCLESYSKVIDSIEISTEVYPKVFISFKELIKSRLLATARLIKLKTLG